MIAMKRIHEDFKDILTEEQIAECRAARDNHRSVIFKDTREKISEGAAAELKSLCDLFREDNYIWLASLWEPEIGGFYYSVSGRDGKGFLPDVQSTAQALNFMETSGLLGGRGRLYQDVLPEDMKEKIKSFTLSLQDEDGFFYHPQWGKHITLSRRGRDLSWATEILGNLGAKPHYPLPFEKRDDGKVSSSVPEHLRSIENLKAHLDSLDIEHKSYQLGNQLQAQLRQFVAAGDEYVDCLIQNLNKRQRADNGLWQEKVNYDSVNGLMKICLIYTALGRPFPNAERALESAIYAALSSQRVTFITQVYNPLVTINNLIANIKKFGDASVAEKLRRTIADNAEGFIRLTREKSVICQCPDGSFSYGVIGTEHNGRIAQYAPVAIADEDEGTVDANGITVSGIYRNTCRILGIEDIPVFSPCDSALFLELLSAARVKPKLYEKPSWFEDYLV